MASFRVLSDSIGIITGLIFGPLLASLNVQLITLSLSKYLALAIILPAGIAARAFKFTREGGAFLIALAIGMQFLWPFLYLINYEISLGISPLNIQAGASPQAAFSPSLGTSTAFDDIYLLIYGGNGLFSNISYGSQLLLQGLVLPVLNLTSFEGAASSIRMNSGSRFTPVSSAASSMPRAAYLSTCTLSMREMSSQNQPQLAYIRAEHSSILSSLIPFSLFSTESLPP
jgi:hypothetical protein